MNAKVKELPGVDRIETPRLKRDWIGKRVRIVRRVISDSAVIATGSLGVITAYTRRGVDIAIDRCPHCQCSHLARGLLSGTDYEFVEERDGAHAD